MWSCLAIPSMGSIVPRMELRKGTIPNTGKEAGEAHLQQTHKCCSAAAPAYAGRRSSRIARAAKKTQLPTARSPILPHKRCQQPQHTAALQQQQLTPLKFTTASRSR